MNLLGQIPDQNQSPLMNVGESFCLYDTMVVSDQFVGSEANVRGWFRDFPTMGQQERHTFFKDRTEALASLAYCNKQTSDLLDFAFEAYSVGVQFRAPTIRNLGDRSATRYIDTFNWSTQVGHFWEVELPRHCSIEFKIQQDSVLELPCMAASPGYGPVGGGCSFAHDQISEIPGQNGSPLAGFYKPVMHAAITQGVPQLSNRFAFKEPKQIPRNAPIECIVTVSEVGRWMLQNLPGWWYYKFNDATHPTPANPGLNYRDFPSRFMIQVSLFGRRLVQQRGQYSV